MEKKEGNVYCTVLVDKQSKVTMAPQVLMKTLKGEVKQDATDVMIRALQSFYSVMVHCGVKNVVVTIDDRTSQFESDKKFQLSLGELPPREELSLEEEEVKKDDTEKV